MPSSSTPQPQKPVGETAEKQPEDFSAAPGEVTAPETEPSPAEQHGTAESGPASSPTARGRVSIPESAPEPAPESEAPAPPPGAYERMVDVDVLFGVMSQVAADVSARIADELPDMIEEALNRHLSGLKSDQ